MTGWMSYVSLCLVGQSGFIVISILSKCSIETYVTVDAVLSFIFSGIYEHMQTITSKWIST